jgi:hypothetical protein
VQRTAIGVAVEQAELRRGVRDVFLNLARRTQALVHRQLTVLDGMERRVTDPDDLDDLFRVDHLATRMRRNAENLIVLSGAVPGRGWRNPVPLVDVVRGAMAEVEDYARVTVLPVGPAALVGRAVGDVIHLLAELVENATSFSPPETAVQVGGQKVAKGYAIEVEDRGLGMSEEDLDAANEQLVNPPEFNLSSTARLGLYVVGRLAQRHGIRVRLRDSPYGGTTAIVLIPSHLIVEAVDTGPAALPRGRPAAIAAGSGNPAGRTSTGLLIRGRTPRSLGTAGPAADPIVVEPAASEPVVEPTSIEPALDRPVLTQPGLEPGPVPGLEPGPVPATAGGDYTENGLPRRVRQANLAEPLREQPPEPVEEPAGDPGGRSPDQIRAMMSSYQRGTKRGRYGASGTDVGDNSGDG